MATNPGDITAAVLRSFEGCSDPRLRVLMSAFARHLHAFAAEVTLTEREWRVLIDTLTATGEITDPHRQEFILWSDSMGLSMLVDALANLSPDGATQSTVLGPFYVPGSPLRAFGERIAEAEDAGIPAWVHGRVRSLDGTPLADAELDIWQNGADRQYAVQRPDGPQDHLRGRFLTRADGSYAFIAVRPVPYPIPDDGPVGRMLAASGRHPWRPAHIHMIVRAPGHRSLATHIFDADSPYLDSDAVFAVKPSLVRTFVERRVEDASRPPGIPPGPWVSLDCDIVLAPGEDAHPLSDPGRTA